MKKSIISLSSFLLLIFPLFSCNVNSGGNAPYSPKPSSSPSRGGELASLTVPSMFALLLSPANDRLHLLDLADDRIKLSLETGRKPTALAVSRNGSYLLVLNELDGTVTSFFREDNTRIQNTGVSGAGVEPTDLIFNSSGTEAFISYHGSGKVTVLEIPNRNRPLAKQVLLLQDKETNYQGKPYKLAVSKDEQTLFVADKEKQKLVIFKRQELFFKKEKIVDLPSINPEDLFFYNENLYLSDRLNDRIVIYNPLSGETSSINLSDTQIGSEILPTKMTVNTKTNKLYVLNEGASTVAVVDLQGKKLEKHILLFSGKNNDSKGPTDLSLTTDGKRLFVTNSSGRNISIISTDTDTLSRNIGTSSSSGNLLPFSAIEIL